jgi:hypothetical protein
MRPTSAFEARPGIRIRIRPRAGSLQPGRVSCASGLVLIGSSAHRAQGRRGRANAGRSRPLHIGHSSDRPVSVCGPPWSQRRNPDAAPPAQSACRPGVDAIQNVSVHVPAWHTCAGASWNGPARNRRTLRGRDRTGHPSHLASTDSPVLRPRARKPCPRLRGASGAASCACPRRDCRRAPRSGQAMVHTFSAIGLRFRYLSIRTDDVSRGTHFALAWRPPFG